MERKHGSILHPHAGYEWYSVTIGDALILHSTASLELLKNVPTHSTMKRNVLVLPLNTHVVAWFG